MKKIIAIVLVCLFAMSFVACGGEEEVSNPTFSTASKNEDATSTNTSKTESSKDETSDTSSSEPVVPVVYTNKFISWGDYTKTDRTKVTANGAASLQLSKVNEPVGERDNGVFTSVYGRTIEVEGQDYANYAVAVFEYKHEKFSYIKTSFAKPGEADAKTAIPEDGFVVVVWKDNTAKITAIENADDTIAFFPHGFIVSTGLDTKIKTAAKAPAIDGKISTAEYGSMVWDIKPDNKYVSYAQFEVNNYYATAEVYMTYDADKLYVGVIVDTPMHDNICNADSAAQMYKYDCIQLNLSAFGADSEYISENWDFHRDTNDITAQDNTVRQYGFGVNNDGETIIHVWMPEGAMAENCEAFCVYDEGAGKIYYEAAIGWDELGTSEFPVEKPVKGDEISISVSINCSNFDEELQQPSLKSIFLRDGGGIIGINDWTKMPTITLD